MLCNVAAIESEAFVRDKAAEGRLAGTQQQVSLTTDRRSYAPGQNVMIQLRVLDPALDNQLKGVKLYAKVTTKTLTDAEATCEAIRAALNRLHRIPLRPCMNKAVPA